MDSSRSFRMELEGLDLQQLQAVRTRNDYRALPRSQSHNPGPGSGMSRSGTLSSSVSRNSAASDRRLISGPAAAVRSQPKGEPEPRASRGKVRAEAESEAGAHMFICERCGRCKCRECRAPRRLPSCWAPGRRCPCSAECVAEHATCLCCVKGLFYHCSAQDDGDSCADRPCSCGSPRGCARWGTMGLLSLCLPCLCCYPPARLCLALCRRAHDRAARPGCRCRNTNTVCRKISASGGRGGYPAPRAESPEKPL
ncbi:hypothetical protein NHX12_010711 [Muraenolepis orangiensis]|uniref:Sprouty n=1 Tax=Muraenolepis orangiensis TaxID=630683 RepID=A0A9Q0I983_9TELE|nr:hypothetical protein NHX12_010711 [Muraenolepis orangiensis]